MNNISSACVHTISEFKKLDKQDSLVIPLDY